MFDVEIDFEDDRFDKLRDAVTSATSEIVEAAAKMTADRARKVHGYTKRTGTMEAQTFHTPAGGAFFQDNLSAKAVGFTAYASRLENGYGRRYAFMRPAWRDVQPLFASVHTFIWDSHLRGAGW